MAFVRTSLILANNFLPLSVALYVLKVMKNFILLLILLSPAITYASTPEETGSITQLLIHRSPTNDQDAGRRFIVKLSSSISNNPCTSGTDSWTGYFSDDTGKAQYSAILAASMAGKEIKIQGTEGFCENNSTLIRNIYTNY